MGSFRIQFLSVSYMFVDSVTNAKCRRGRPSYGELSQVDFVPPEELELSEDLAEDLVLLLEESPEEPELSDLLGAGAEDC